MTHSCLGLWGPWCVQGVIIVSIVRSHDEMKAGKAATGGARKRRAIRRVRKPAPATGAANSVSILPSVPDVSTADAASHVAPGRPARAVNVNSGADVHSSLLINDEVDSNASRAAGSYQSNV